MKKPIGECTCGSHLARKVQYDARGIFLYFYCEMCEARKRTMFRKDIFTNPNYWADEPINSED